MTITDDDLNYLRNINTRPGPNAGRSIDPTKPGPDDARAQSAIPPLRYGPAEHMPDGTEIRRLEVDALLYIKRALAPYMEDKLDAAIRTVETALAQSNAGPKHDVRVTDAMVEAAGEAWLRARFNIGRDGITEDCWFEILSAMRVVLDALAEAIAAEIQGKPEFKEMIAREKPEASGLIEVLAGDLGLILRGLIAKYHGPLRSRAADRSVHRELIPDCPTDGVAARQGNGG